MILAILAGLVVLTASSHQQSGFDESNTTLSTPQDVIHHLDMKIKALKGKMEKNGETGVLESTVDILQQMIQTMEWMNALLPNATKSTVETDQQAMKTTIGAVQSTLGIIQETMKTMESKIDKNSALKSTVDAHLAKINAIERMIGATIKKENFDSLKSTVDTLQKTIQDMQSKIDRLEKVVVFRATLNKDRLHVPAGIVVFDYVMENVGNGYNPSTGYFTVPVTGLYVFTAQCFSDGAQDINCDLYVSPRSGSNYMAMRSRDLTTFDKSVVSVYVTSLNDQDRVFVSNRFPTKNWGTRASFFSGWLVKSY